MFAGKGRLSISAQTSRGLGACGAFEDAPGRVRLPFGRGPETSAGVGVVFSICLPFGLIHRRKCVAKPRMWFFDYIRTSPSKLAGWPPYMVAVPALLFSVAWKKRLPA